MAGKDFVPVFAALRRILAPYGGSMDTKADSATHFSLDTWHVQKNQKPLFFGAVQIRKNYVSYHLMPVYVEPALLEGISPGLKRRMQGKSCFNFTTMEPALFTELAALTQRGYQSYERQGFA